MRLLEDSHLLSKTRTEADKLAGDEAIDTARRGWPCASEGRRRFDDVRARLLIRERRKLDGLDVGHFAPRFWVW
jgi:hypothetical protein